MFGRVTVAFLTLSIFGGCAGTAANALATNSLQLMEGGSAVATGAKVLWTNEGTIYFRETSESTSNVWSVCETARMTGTLTKNDGSNIEETIESAKVEGNGETTTGECASPFGGTSFETSEGNGPPWCLRSTSTMATDEFQIRGNSCANAARGITFVLNSTTVGKCKYERTTLVGPLKGTFSTGGTATASIAGQEFKREEGNFLCPEKWYLSVSFTLETDASPFPSLTIN